MFVILTSRIGQFRTEATDGITPVESYDYVFYGKRTARFVIAELAADTKVRVVEDAPPGIVNLVPTKFLDKFDTVESARAALRELATFGSMDIALVPSAPTLAAVPTVHS